MKRIAAIICLLALFSARSTFAQAEVIDGIAAVVNSDVITYSQVRELIGARERALRASLQGEELANQIKEIRFAALKDLIDRQLIIQEFNKKGLNIPPHLLEDRIQTVIRQEFGGDRSAFVRTLRSQGYSVSKFKEIERDKVIVQAMRQTFVRDDFVISPAQIQAFYDKNKDSYATPEQIKLRMIVLRDDGDLGLPGGKKAMAEEIRSKIIGGADFGRMAQMYSEDPATQEVEGDWGWIDRKTLSSQLTEHAFALKAGEVSSIIEIGGSYYIMMVEARKNAAVKPISEVRDEIEQNLIQQERGKEMQRWLDTLRQNAYIKIYS